MEGAAAEALPVKAAVAKSKEHMPLYRQSDVDPRVGSCSTAPFWPTGWRRRPFTSPPLIERMSALMKLSGRVFYGRHEGSGARRRERWDVIFASFCATLAAMAEPLRPS
jgi:hypothetical protein